MCAHIDCVCSCSQKILGDLSSREKERSHIMPCGFSQRSGTNSNAVARAKTIFCLMNSAAIYSGARARSQRHNQKLASGCTSECLLKCSHSCITSHLCAQPTFCVPREYLHRRPPPLFANIAFLSWIHTARSMERTRLVRTLKEVIGKRAGTGFRKNCCFAFLLYITANSVRSREWTIHTARLNCMNFCQTKPFIKCRFCAVIDLDYFN